LHFDEWVKNQLLLAELPLDDPRERRGGEASCLNLAEQRERNHTAFVEDDLLRIGRLTEHGHTKCVTGIKRVAARPGGAGGHCDEHDRSTNDPKASEDEPNHRGISEVALLPPVPL